MVKSTKGKPPNADNDKEVHQPVVGEAEPRKAGCKKELSLARSRLIKMRFHGYS